MQLTDDRSCVDFSTSHKQPLKGVVGEVDQMLANRNAAAGFSENSRDRDQEGSDAKRQWTGFERQSPRRNEPLFLGKEFMLARTSDRRSREFKFSANFRDTP